MTILPNPFDSGAAYSCPPDDAAVSASPHASDTAADLHEPVTATSSLDETDCIAEIFHFARKLGADRRFVLNELEFMEALEEPPLFLQRPTV